MSELSDVEQLRQPSLDLPVSRPEDGRATPGEALELAGLAPVAAPADALTPPTTPLPEPTAAPAAAAPAARPITLLLRVGRLLSGVALLALAWGFLLVVLLLIHAAWNFLHGSGAVLVRAATGIGAALAAVWLVVAMIACLLAGAYCLMLAFSRRGW